MIRYICREDDIGAAANVGGPVQSTYHTFTDVAAVERWISMLDLDSGARRWLTRTIIACEVVPEMDKEAKGE